MSLITLYVKISRTLKTLVHVQGHTTRLPGTRSIWMVSGDSFIQRIVLKRNNSQVLELWGHCLTLASAAIFSDTFLSNPSYSGHLVGTFLILSCGVLLSKLGVNDKRAKDMLSCSEDRFSSGNCCLLALFSCEVIWTGLLWLFFTFFVCLIDWSCAF